MSFLADMIGGTIQSARSQIKEEQAANNEELRYQKRLEFQKKLEEDLAKRRPTSTILQGDKVILLNAWGEPVGERMATAAELRGEKVAARTAETQLEDMSPKERTRKRKMEEEEHSSNISARRAQANQANALAAESGTRRKVAEYELNTVQDAMGDLGPPSLRGGSALTGAGKSGGGLTVRDADTIGKTMGALRAELNRAKLSGTEEDKQKAIAIEEELRRMALMSPEEKQLAARELMGVLGLVVPE